MYEQKYVVFRGKGDREMYWTGKLGRGRLAKSESPDFAKTFDSAEEAYLTIDVLVKNGYLPQIWLDSRIGKRYVVDEPVTIQRSCGAKQGSDAMGWGGMRVEGG